jgi:hypothetical protein
VSGNYHVAASDAVKPALPVREMVQRPRQSQWFQKEKRWRAGCSHLERRGEAMMTEAACRLCGRFEAPIKAKYNEFRHTTPEIQRLPRHSNPGNPASGITPQNPSA